MPVVALLTDAEPGGPGGLRQEKSSEMALLRGVLAAEPAITAFGLLPGAHGTDLTLCLVPGAAATQAQVNDAVERVTASVMAGAEGRVRRGIEVALTAAGPTGAGLAGDGVT